MGLCGGRRESDGGAGVERGRRFVFASPHNVGTLGRTHVPKSGQSGMIARMQGRRERPASGVTKRLIVFVHFSLHVLRAFVLGDSQCREKGGEVKVGTYTFVVLGAVKRLKLTGDRIKASASVLNQGFDLLKATVVHGNYSLWYMPAMARAIETNQRGGRRKAFATLAGEGIEFEAPEAFATEPIGSDPHKSVG